MSRVKEYCLNRGKFCTDNTFLHNGFITMAELIASPK